MAFRRHRPPIRRALGPFLIACSFLSAAGTAQGEGVDPLPDEVFSEQIGIEVVNVDVVVPGTYQLGVGIWDELAATGSFLNVPVEAILAAAGEGASTE